MNHAESFEQPAAQAFQKVIHIPIRPALQRALSNIAYPQTEVYENASTALSRVAGLSKMLAEASLLATNSNYHSLSYSGIYELAESIHQETTALHLMLDELANYFVVLEKQTA